MSDKFPYFAGETGTYSTTGPAVALSGTAANLGTYPVMTFAEAAADATQDFDDTNTCTVTIWKDATNFARYTGAAWNDASPDNISLATATKVGGKGTLSDSDSVTVVGSLPTPLVSGGDAGTPSALVLTNATGLPIAAVDLDGGTDIGADLVDADLILVDDGAAGTNRKAAMSRVRTYVRTGVVREFYVDAAAMVPRKTNGAFAYTEEYATNDVTVDYYLFDSITEKGVQFKLALPDSWNLGTIRVKFFWDAATGASVSDGVTWGIAARAVSNDDAIDAAFPASVDTDDVVIAVGDLHVSPASVEVTVSGTPALGDLILVEVTRVVGDAQDDMAEDAKLFGIQIQYTESTTAPSAWG